MQKGSVDIIIFLIVASALVATMAIFIFTIFFLYRKRQVFFRKEIEEYKLAYEKSILSAQLEMQEHTFQNISREIHDNISLSLTLAKIHLHTLDLKSVDQALVKINSSIGLLTKTIYDLSDISKSLNSDVIIQQGLLQAFEYEVKRINQIGSIKIKLRIDGTPLYMDSKMELIIFRVVQEAFNNIIKHSKAKSADLILNYDPTLLYINIIDNGVGFDIGTINPSRQAGLKNMESRIKMLRGNMSLRSMAGVGTSLTFTIPID